MPARRFLATALAAAALGGSLSGCVAAAFIPLVAAGATGVVAIRESAVKSVSEYSAETNGKSKLAAADRRVSSKVSVSAAAQLAQIAAGYRRDAPATVYLDFLRFSLTQAEKYDEGEDVRSVILAAGSAPEQKKFVACDGLPLAVMIDLDGGIDTLSKTAEQNTGVADLAKSLAALRNTGISVIWLSDHPASQADTMIVALKSSGLMEEGDDDFLSLDRGNGDRKQARRTEASDRFCIVAMAGDRKSDFDELFTYLRDPSAFMTLDTMWDAGWFIKPVPDIANLTPAQTVLTQKATELP